MKRTIWVLYGFVLAVILYLMFDFAGFVQFTPNRLDRQQQEEIR